MLPQGFGQCDSALLAKNEDEPQIIRAVPPLAFSFCPFLFEKKWAQPRRGGAIIKSVGRFYSILSAGRHIFPFYPPGG